MEREKIVFFRKTKLEAMGNNDGGVKRYIGKLGRSLDKKWHRHAYKSYPNTCSPLSSA